ncbi:autotransporter outer membrane beta-barrel domain-containing protein [Pseudomonas sp. CM27]|uniref:autotransporter outer membrane beta-barrel domain-containing protein n=1 Tax=Pseudomonas sp. CM27 TaxID=2738452 RepID=UPI001554DCA9|nr:autotransporter outer membrane beta-barrel domain-containing protein [Pseudomonas sp. CM27]NQD73539.1 autotransporter outer membrane beta-barrel domain-containing protein [Pseudomonas sp. CM27]
MSSHPRSTFYSLRHLTLLGKLSPLLLATSAWAQTNVTKDTLIDAGSALDSYRVIGPATLTANGAKMLQVFAEAGATVTFSDSRIDALNNANGLTLWGADATLQRTTVVSESRGLSLTADSSAGRHSQALVIDSNISGARQGALVNDSTLELQRSELRGTGAAGLGADLFNGTLIAREGSTISGSQNGVRLREGSSPSGNSTLVVDNSLVEGVNGSAIVVGIGAIRPASAHIDVLNRSTLRAGNGVLLEVEHSADATLRVNDSQLEGDVVVAEGGSAAVQLENFATLKGRLENVASLAIDSNAQWVMVGDAHVGALSMDGGSVRFGELNEFFTLSLDSLAGNGTFVMEADFSSGQSDKLDVTGNASGNHTLLINSSGHDPHAENSLHMVHTGGGDAQFELQGGPVDLGAYSYDLVRKGDNDWFLDLTTRVVSPGTQSVMALANAAPTIWYGELGTLRSRMGEVRRNPANSGAWVRTFGNKYNVAASAGVAYQQHQQGLSFGADTPLSAGDGNWLVGVTAGISTSDLNLARGSSATVDSYHIGAYTSWFEAESGYYFDATARLNRFENSLDVRLSDGKKTEGDYTSQGLGVSLEVGRHLSLADGYFLEPFAQLSGLVVQGKDYSLDNGMSTEGERTRSLLGKLGATTGRTFTAADGRTLQPYLRVAAVHEWANDNQVKVNGNRFANDLSGTRGEVGVGLALSWAEQWQAHADFDYSHGSKIEQPWGVNLGVRYSW